MKDDCIFHLFSYFEYELLLYQSDCGKNFKFFQKNVCHFGFNNIFFPLLSRYSFSNKVIEASFTRHYHVILELTQLFAYQHVISLTAVSFRVIMGHKESQKAKRWLIERKAKDND